MNKIIPLLLLFIPIICLGQTSEKSVVAANGDRIGFLEFRPPDYSAAKHPLIIFLHGIGEKGNGTTELRKVHCCGIPSYIGRGNKMKFSWLGKTESFVVISPQLSKKYAFWQPFYTDEMIKYAKANLNIDPDRIFVTGLSMGGGGTWNFASSSLARAEMLAGIAPVVAPCMMSNGCNIAKASLPVMAIHVWDDKDAAASCTVNAIKSINACSPQVSPNLIMYASGGHYVWVKRAFDTAHNYQDPNMYEWFLAQNRNFAPNKKPVARAGTDQSITTSDASVTLSAANSSDPDGSIVKYIWSKIAGPKKGLLKGAYTKTLNISDLTTPGTYKYQLEVVDNRAEWSYDTVLVTVKKGDPTPNKSPLANAGSDTTINLSASLMLDGSQSTDPDGNIAAFQWSKEDGPEKYKFADEWNARTAVSDLVAGTYIFKLTVTDNRGATTSDEIEVTVKGLAGDNDSRQQPPVNSNAILVYPNPAKSSIMLVINSAVNGNTVATIYDETGKLMSRTSFIKSQNSFQQRLNTVNLNRGLFYIDVLIGTRARFRTKFIKQ